MARIAELIPFLLHQELWDYAVPQMAVFALLLLHNRVDALHAQIFLGKLRMAVEALLASEFHLGRRSVGFCTDDNAAEDRRHPYNESFSHEPSGHLFTSISVFRPFLGRAGIRKIDFHVGSPPKFVSPLSHRLVKLF